eukprot:TRINITY_DN1054_c0_g1_i1.p1 TRINITY_DN1054_c0_g1~~TRINITY_DN1054_c0_g1_i1.p1  ORF type:complete len:1368 (-),score=190.11 TRINITY_DN1054_c0_g1_i1:4386-8489(-)
MPCGFPTIRTHVAAIFLVPAAAFRNFVFMSGVEVVGLVLGVLGPLQQAIDLTIHIRQRRAAQRANTHTLQQLLNRLNQRKHQLSQLHQQLSQNALMLPPVNEQQFRCEMARVHQLFVELSAALSSISARLSLRSWLSCVSHFCAAMSITADLDAISAKLYHADQIIISVRSLFVLVSTIQVQTDALMRHQSNKISALQENITRTFNAETLPRNQPRDVFTPSKVRPWIPLNSVCDFDSCDRNGKPDTVLAHLKLHVLSLGEQESFMTSVHGEGGIGKTTAINSLSLHPEIRACYVDGIYTITLGLDATEATLVLELCKIVRQSGGPRLANTLQAKELTKDVLLGAADWFRNRKFLLLVDDVWNIPPQGKTIIYDLYDFVAVGDHSALVYTTRDVELATLAKSYKLTRWAPLSSRRLLLKFAGYGDEDDIDVNVDSIIDSVVQKCQGLPVLLSVVGRIISETIATVEGDSGLVWKWFVTQQHRLLELEADRYGSIKSVFLSVLRALDHYHGVDRFLFKLHYKFIDMHRALCVIQKQEWAPLTILGFLWKLETETQAAQVLRLFASVGLLISLYKGDGEKTVQGAAMHDLFLDYEKREAEHRGEMTDWHRSVVDGYVENWNLTNGNENECREWWRANPDDACYFKQNIVRHLGEAGLGQEMVTLVTRPQWIEKRVREDGFMLYLQELDFVIDRCQRDERLSSDEGMKTIELKVIKKALRLSYDYIHDMREGDVEIWFQLHGRLFDMAAVNRSIQSYVNYIVTHAPRPWLQPGGGCLTPATEGVDIVTSHDSSVRCLKVSCDGKTWLAGGSNGKLYGGSVSDVIENNVDHDAHNSSIVCLAHSTNGKLAASGSNDGSVKVWKQEGNHYSLVETMSHTKAVNGIAFSVNDEMIVSCGQDGNICSWNVATGRGDTAPVHCVERAHGGGSVRAIEVLNGSVVVSAGDDKKIRFWTLKDLSERKEYEITCASRVFTLAVSSDGRTLAAGLEDCTVRVWKVNEDGAILESEQIDSDERARRASALAISGDGDLLIIGTMNGLVYVWSLKTKTRVGRMPQWGAASITGVGLIMVGQELCCIWSSGSGTIRVSEVSRDASGERFGTARGLTLSKSGAEVVVANEDGFIEIIDIASRKPITEAFRVGHPLSVAELTPDGKTMVFAAHDGYVGIWDVSRRTCIREWREHTRPILSIAVSENGRHLASSSSDGSVRVWDLENADVKCSILTEGTKAIWNVYFGKDSERDMITVSDDQTMTLWQDRREIRSVTVDGATWCMSRREAFREFGNKIDCSGVDQVVCFKNQLMLVGSDGTVKCRLGSIEQNMLPRHWKYSVSTHTFCVTAPAGVVAYQTSSASGTILKTHKRSDSFLSRAWMHW